MYLENLVFDARDPWTLGRFWEAALGTETLTDDPGGYETRLAVPDGPDLDLCFQPVAQPAHGPRRLHLDLRGGAEQQQVVDRLLELGATRADIGQGDVPWVVLADPEGNAFCVMEERAAYVGTGPVAALVLWSADPERDRDFWQWLSGWEPVDEGGVLALRHPSGRGPLLELVPEDEPKRGSTKNHLHLDLRLEPGDDEPETVAQSILARGGQELPDNPEVPWRTYLDPSGNELCVLPARG
ncbi:VOC family protein [Nocardioides sp. 503]|uniref:VOC family protein n=1 Tax=Nocardioides sp. 503 TaxID=2508326 RepID=UPI00107009BD|nr:VOC family protein [Nocardioides sp. 503]